MISGLHHWETRKYTPDGEQFLINHKGPRDNNTAWCFCLTEPRSGWSSLDDIGEEYE